MDIIVTLLLILILLGSLGGLGGNLGWHQYGTTPFVGGSGLLLIVLLVLLLSGRL